MSPNGLVQTALVAMANDVVNGSGTQAGDAIKVLRADIKPLISGADLYEGVTGSAAQQLDSQQSGNKAEQIVLLATLILILVLLLIIFRSPIIALMPIITIAIVAEVAQGLIADVNSALNLNADSQTTVILIVVLFGIGTDYILFLMFRYRERLRPQAHAAAPPGTYALVGGTTAVFADIQAATNHDYAVVFPVAAAIILVILMLLLRSLVAPWYLMLSVGLGFGATLGPRCWSSRRSPGRRAWSSCCRCTCTCSWWRSAPTTTS